MDLDNFYAINFEKAPLPLGKGEYREANLTTHELGVVPLPSQTVGAADPFVMYDPLRFQAPASEGRAVVTIADVSEAQDGSHLREAYLSILFSSEKPHALAPAVHTEAPAEEIDSVDGYYGVSVDAGTVAFFDAVAMTSYADSLSSEEAEERDEEWFDAMDEKEIHPDGLALVAYPDEDSENVIAISHSGWGDGFYPVLKTLDENGNVLGLHIDLLVVGNQDD